MGFRLFRFGFNTLVNMTWLLCSFYLVVLVDELSNLDTFRLPFQIASPFVLTEFLAPYWPKHILISLGIFGLFLAICSNTAVRLLGKIKISGSVLIPLLILMYIAIVAVCIVSSDITHPTRIRDARLFPILLLAWGSIVYIPLLVYLNNCLAKPAPAILLMIMLIALFGASYLALINWLYFLQSGEIDYSQALQLVV